MNSGKRWYYKRGEEQMGPFSDEEMQHLVDTGAIGGATLVWADGQTDWLPISRVGGFQTPGAIPDVEENVEYGDGSGAEQDVSYYPAARPWVRYWARMMDLILFALIFGILVGIFCPSALMMNDNVLGVLILFLFVFVEPILLSSWGATPGKALLRVTLRTNSGGKLSYVEALGRSFNVWVRGLGLGLPLISLVTLIVAYNRLSKNGITSWDRKGGFSVTHEKIGALRVAVYIGIVICVIFLIAATAGA
ncbi:MAG: RDD family protein [Deltaproteobacteria bacterium]|nr:RDD family protein [Deltaproteobacteria bacterium]